MDDLHRLPEFDAIYLAWQGFHPIGGISDRLIELFPKSLKIITVCSTGYDGYNPLRLAEKGIALCNTPLLGALSVAETLIYLLLTGFRHYHVFNKTLKHHAHTIEARRYLQECSFDLESGLFRENSDMTPGFSFGERVGPLHVESLVDKTVTVVGFGNIGQLIGLRLWALGMKVNYVKRTPLQSQLIYPATGYTDLDQCIGDSEVIILSVPGTPETKDLINSQVLDKLPPGCIIINVSRGGVVNEQDVLQLLKLGKVRFLGLDVFSKEPMVDLELLNRDDVYCLPHVGSAVSQVYDKSSINCLRNIESCLSGKPFDRVN